MWRNSLRSFGDDGITHKTLGSSALVKHNSSEIDAIEETTQKIGKASQFGIIEEAPQQNSRITMNVTKRLSMGTQCLSMISGQSIKPVPKHHKKEIKNNYKQNSYLSKIDNIDEVIYGIHSKEPRKLDELNEKNHIDISAKHSSKQLDFLSKNVKTGISGKSPAQIIGSKRKPLMIESMHSGSSKKGK